MSSIYVSDHAVLRWLEREHEIPVDNARERIKQLVTKAVSVRAASVKVGNVVFTLSYNGTIVHVTTALPRHAIKREPRGQPGK